MSDIFVFAGTAIVASAIIVLIKQYKPEFAFAVTVISGILFLFYIVSFFENIFIFIEKLKDFSGIDSGYFEVLFKCFGICVITKIASETCADYGQTSISSKIELAGKCLVLISSMPLFEEIIETVSFIIGI